MNNKSAAIVAMATDMLSALDAGNPITETARASMHRFAAMVTPLDASLAERLMVAAA